MRSRITLFCTLAVLGVALTLPASAAAAESGYKYKVVYNYCDGKTVHFKAKNIAEGWTPANRLTIESWAQKKVNGSWRTIHAWDRANYKFTANGDRHWLTSWRQYNGVPGNKFRIMFRLRAWENRQQLASVVVTSVNC
jgi:hypothetical protein